MKVFVTGASGWIGSATVTELINAGHSVRGLARSDESAAKIEALGAEAVRGDLSSLDVLAAEATAAEGVIHAGFIHDFSDFMTSIMTDRTAIQAMTDVMVGTNKPFVFASGILAFTSDGPLTEDIKNVSPNPRGETENNTLDLAAKDIRVSAIRLAPTVHGDGDKGFMPVIVKAAKDSGESSYVGDGTTHWPAVHRFDAANLFRLALENGKAGSAYHAIADQGIEIKTIAETIGAGLNLPVSSISLEEAGTRFGFLGNFLQIDCVASSAKTQAELAWTPTHAGLIEDLESGVYYR